MMSRVIFMLTLRQLAGQKRTLLMLLFAALPIAIAVIYRLAADETDRVDFVANGLLSGLVVAIVLPLTALIFGTAALGAEIEDGTAVYLLAKPIPRWRIVLPKVLAAWLATAVLVFVAAAVSGGIAIAGEPGGSLVPAFAIAVLAGSLVYCTRNRSSPTGRYCTSYASASPFGSSALQENVWMPFWYSLRL